MNTRTTTDFQPQHSMKSTEDDMFKPLKFSAEEYWTSPQTAPASLIINQFEFYHASTDVFIVNVQRSKWRWFIEFYLKTLIVVSVCFSWALDPWLYNNSCSSGCCNWVFMAHICYGPKASVSMWLCFDNDLWSYESSFSVMIVWSLYWSLIKISLYKLQWFCCKAKCCDNRILKTSMVSCWLTQTSRISIWISTVVTFQKRVMLQWMLKAVYELCIMVLPSMHCSMNCFFKWSPFLRFISWVLMSVLIIVMHFFFVCTNCL